MHTDANKDDKTIFEPVSNAEVIGNPLFSSLLNHGSSLAVAEQRGDRHDVEDPVIWRRGAEGKQAAVGDVGRVRLLGGENDDAKGQRRKGTRTALQVVCVVLGDLIAESVHDADVFATYSSLSAEGEPL